MGWLDSLVEFLNPCNWNSHEWRQYKVEDSYMGGLMTARTIYWKCDNCGIDRFNDSKRFGKA